jgi:hypothetical protein
MVMIGIKITTSKRGATTALNSSQPPADSISDNQVVKNELVINNRIDSIAGSQNKKNRKPQIKLTKRKGLKLNQRILGCIKPRIAEPSDLNTDTFKRVTLR